MPQLSNYGICYEAVQRVYRNAVLQYARARLEVAFPDDFTAKVRQPFKHEWPKISAAANERRESGEISNLLIDDLDILGVNHFYNLFELHYPVLVSEDNANPVQLKTNKQTLLGWFKAVKSLRDPMSHPSEQDLSFEDAFAMLDPARRVLLKLNLTATAADIKAWMDELASSGMTIEAAAEPLEDRLPPKESILVDFIGRKKEIEALESWFSDSTARRWALAGEGGKGKSAIAYRFATEIKLTAPEPYQIVLWISAKRRQFTEGEVNEIAAPDFTDLASALNKLLDAYGWNELKGASLPDKRKKVLELLDSFPALLIVDDADSLEGESEDAAEFFTFEAPRTKSKILLTSRRVLFGMGNTTTHVSGLQGIEANDFMSSRCRLTELDINAVRPFFNDILKVTEGSPLYIEDLLRLCSVMPISHAIAAWKERSGDKAREYALSRELEMLTPRSQQVLMAFCMPTKPVSHYEIEAMTGFSAEEIGSALKELQKLFLVPKPALFEGEERFNVNVNTRLLVKKAMGKMDAFRRIQQAYTNITKGETATNDEVVAAAIRRANFAVRAGELAKAEETLTSALHIRPNQPNLLGFLAWTYKAWFPQRTTDARENFQRASQLGCKDADMYRHWSRMEAEHKEWVRSAEAAEAGIKLLGPVASLSHLAGYARCRLGRELYSGLHAEKAEAELQRARKHLRVALKREDGMKPEADAYRAMILACEYSTTSREIAEYFDQWFAAYPDHPDFQSEWVRLAARFALDVRRYSGNARLVTQGSS